MTTKVLIASGGGNEANLIPSGSFKAVFAQLLGEEEPLEEREVCGTLHSSLNPRAAAQLPDALVLMGKSQLHH